MLTINALTPRLSFEYQGVRTQIYLGDVGTGLPRHQHTFVNLTVCVQGSVKITKEKSSKIVKANDAAVVLTALEWHELEVLEPNTIFINMFEVIDG